MKYLLALTLALMVSALVCGRAAAQATAPASNPGLASLKGTVTDQTGAVLPGATVTASNGASSTHTATTNDRGEYTIAALPPSTYTLTIDEPGFKEFRTEGLVLAPGQDVVRDASLELAGEKTEVSVEGQKVSQVETESSEVAGTITQQELVKFGLNGRNFTQLIALTPGVSNQTGQDEAKVGITGSVRYSVNGGRVEYNTFNVDGGDVLNAGLNGNQSTLIVYPSLDALNEVQVLTSNYGAMYGRTASGTVLAETKSGTNAFHGNAYEFVRDEIFNARNYFDETAHAPLYRRNDFGGTLGGPLYIPGFYNNSKDKTYFFFSEEFHLERTPVGPGGDKTSYNQAVPSLAERDGIFSDVCPFTTPAGDGLPGGQSTFYRLPNPSASKVYPDCPGLKTQVIVPTGNPEVPYAQQYITFPGNQVPIDPNAAAILATNTIPAPNASTGCNSTIDSCFNSVVSPQTYWRQELVRLDHNINPNIRLMAHYIHDSWDTTILSPQWAVVQNSFPYIQSTFTGPGNSFVTHLVNTVSPTTLNDFMFSFTTDHIHLYNIDSNNAQWQRPANLSMGYIFNNGFGGKTPGIVISGTNQEYGGLGFAEDPGYLPWHHSNPAYNFRDDLSKVLGRHTVQMGVQVVLAQRNELNQPVGANTGDLQGILTFSNVSSFNTTGNAFADFLLARPNGNGGIKTFQQDSAQYNYYQRYQVYEPYLQDDWRMNSRLTLNLGLRVSLFGNWHEKYDNVYNWAPSAFNRNLAATTTVDTFFGYLAQAGTCNATGSGCQPIPLNPGSLDPRILNGLEQCGANGVPAGCMSPKWFNPAPRIGFAWDPTGTGKTSIRAGYGIFFHHGTGNEANTGSLEGSPPTVLDMTQNKPFTWECIGGFGAGCGPSGAFPLNVTAIPTHSVWPYVQQWSFSVQRELAKNTVGTLGYVGSKGTHLTAELQVNQLAPAPASDNPFLAGGPGAGAPITTALCDSYSQPQPGSPGSFTFSNPTTGASTLWYSTNNPAFVNLEAACFGTPGKNFPDVNSLRTYAPGMGQIYSLQNVANSTYNAMQATVRRVSGPLTLGVAYTWSHSIDDASDRSTTNLVNAFDLEQNRASSDYDQRQLLNVSYVYRLPSLSQALSNWDHGVNSGKPSDTPQPPSRFAKALADGWEFSGITTYQSGTPFSVINGASSNGISVLDNAGVANGTTFASYPDVVGNPRSALPAGANNPSSVGPTLINPAVFVAPVGLTFGDAGRNFLNNPGRLNFDMALLKHFRVTEGSNLEFRTEAFNVFNHTQFRIYDPDLGNTGSNTISCYGGPNNSAGDPSCLTGSAFLHPVDAHRARTMQLGLKYNF
ncbi:MAG TPA: carboxypeptidase regulatory-like domain-containing protein [Terriglobales bacterium]